MSCYKSRNAFNAPIFGGMFVSTDGVHHFIPDQWLNQVEILADETLVRFSYTFCSVEVSGQRLGPLYEDAVVGKLGIIKAKSMDAPSSELWVTSIVFVPLPAFSPSDAECGHA